MRCPARDWTSSEVDHLFRLKDEHHLDWHLIGIKLGRTASSCQAKYHRRCVELGEAETQAVKPSAEQIADADARLFRPRSITAWICADPAPGFSALDRKMVEQKCP
jgi:Myb-like DNA-binding protein